MINLPMNDRISRRSKGEKHYNRNSKSSNLLTLFTD
jgi:hypothetical protein